MLHLAFLDQVAQSSDRLFDRSGWIDPVLIVEVDVIGADALERAFDRDPDVLWVAVNCKSITVAVRDQSELRRQNDITTTPRERAAHELFVRVRPVDLSGVDEIDAKVEGSVDGADGLRVIGSRAGVVSGHAHGPKADPRNVQ